MGAEEFAVDILLTREVVLMRDITPVPETEGYVEGVMNLRGHLVPVIDLSKRLRAFRPASNGERRIIIANIGGKLAGLIVDGASEVVRVNDEMIEAVPDLMSEIGADYVQGVVNLSGRFLTLIDFEKALSGDIAWELDRVMDVVTRGREVVAPAQSA